MFKTKFFFLLMTTSLCGALFAALGPERPLNRPGESLADHSKFKELNVAFTGRSDIMKTCVKCHNLSKDHIREVTHWTWQCDDQGKRVQRDISNPHLSKGMDHEDLRGNCLDCHKDFQAFSSSTPDSDRAPKVDCLICHDISNEYINITKKKGSFKISKEKMNYIAKNIEYPAKINCGNCHFQSKQLKYNDFPKDFALDKYQGDVHMSKDGKNFRCRTCHTSFKHMLSDNCKETSLGYKHKKNLKGEDIDRNLVDMSSCESCHGLDPHKDSKLNDHTDVVACQTCHIRSENGTNVTTEYRWYDGLTKKKVVITDISYESSGEIILRNSPLKGRRRESRIFPFKVLHEKSSKQIKTYWPKNHLVVKKEQALNCSDCHKKESVILGSINDDIYIPGSYGSNTPIIFNFDFWALIGILATLFGVSVHGLGRIFFGIMRKK